VRLYLHASIIDRSQSDISATIDMSATVLDAFDLVKWKKRLQSRRPVGVRMQNIAIAPNSESKIQNSGFSGDVTPR